MEIQPPWTESRLNGMIYIFNDSVTIWFYEVLKRALRCKDNTKSLELKVHFLWFGRKLKSCFGQRGLLQNISCPLIDTLTVDFCCCSDCHMNLWRNP